MEYNKLNNFYLALTDKEFFRLPLNFFRTVFARGSITSWSLGKWTRTQA